MSEIYVFGIAGSHESKIKRSLNDIYVLILKQMFTVRYNNAQWSVNHVKSDWFALKERLQKTASKVKIKKLR